MVKRCNAAHDWLICTLAKTCPERGESMSRFLITVSPAIIILSALSVSRTQAQCVTIDFDDLAVDTILNTQYDGVTFSGRGTDGPSSVAPIIYDPPNGTTSETKCLSARGDATGVISPEFIRIQFDRNQTEVTFTLGVRAGCNSLDTVQVRWYDFPDTLRGTRNVPVNGDLANRVLTFVRIERPAGFRRIEVEASAAGGCADRFELIDDLTFAIDPTPSTALITLPPACACLNGLVEIRGTVQDDHLGDWKLQYTGGDATNWVTLASGGGQVLDEVLDVWDTRDLPECGYTLRLLVTDKATVNCTGPHPTEYLIPVEVGPCNDFDTDHDGDVDLSDYSRFENAFTGP